MGNAQEESRFSQVGGLVKALIWPFLLVGFFIWFYAPLSASIRLIPEKLRESKKISVGSLSFEIEQVAAQKGDARAVVSLRDLPQPAIKRLLNTGQGLTRLVATNDQDPDDISIWDLESISALVDAGLLHVRRESTSSEYKDFSGATLETLLQDITGSNDVRALEELKHRGYTGIATEVVRAKSKVVLDWVLELGWEREKEEEEDRHRLKQKLSPEQRQSLLRVDFELSPSGRALYDAMVAVVSERLSTSEKRGRDADALGGKPLPNHAPQPTP